LPVIPLLSSRSLKHRMLTAAAALLTGYGALCGLVWWRQTDLILFPTQEMLGTPADLGLTYQDLRIATSDGSLLQAWKIPPPAGSQRPWVLHCHGNGGNLSYRLEVAQQLHRLGLGVWLFDYRGYGQSQGRIRQEEDLLADGKAVYDELAQLHQPIILYGESLGGGVASYLALKNPCSGLILQSTFTSLTDRAGEAYPFLPIRWISRFRLDTRKRLPDLKCPVLVLHSRQDEMIGYHHGQQLLQAAGSKGSWGELSGGHNEVDFRQVAQAVEGWLKQLAQGSLVE